MEIDYVLRDAALERLLSDLEVDNRPADRARLDLRLSALPDDEKKILMLSYKDGLSLPEISEVLGMDEDWVRQRHALAVLRLRGRS